jgi:hypothetical protein
MEKPPHTKKHGAIVEVHQDEIISQFQDFGKHQAIFGFLSSFVISIKSVP